METRKGKLLKQMATIGWLAIGTAVDLGPLHKGFNSAADQVKRFAGTLTGIAAAAGVALSANAFKDYVLSTVNAITETKHLAERVGFSTEDSESWPMPLGSQG